MSYAHDVRLVLLAVLICSVATLTAFSLLERVQGAGTTRTVWMTISAVVAGVGVWSTHFIAMLSHDHARRVGYDPTLTALSVVLAALGIGLAWFSLRRSSLAAKGLGGR